jgi:hypothetical protein
MPGGGGGGVPARRIALDEGRLGGVSPPERAVAQSSADMGVSPARDEPAGDVGGRHAARANDSGSDGSLGGGGGGGGRGVASHAWSWTSIGSTLSADVRGAVGAKGEAGAEAA